MAKLTDKQKQFVNEYIVDLNATQAAIRAGYSQRTADRIGPELLGKTCVANAIQEAQQRREKRTEITADRVVKELWNIITADPNEITELRRTCCRFCWGKDHKYQRTANELKKARNDYELNVIEANNKGKELPPFDEGGGIGYNATREPNPDCPECFGEGVMSPFFKDTRNLSSGAKSLYAGVKVGQGGIEVKMHSKDKAMELLGRHLGMFVDRKEISGANGGPIETVDITNPEERRARIDALLARRNGT